MECTFTITVKFGCQLQTYRGNMLFPNALVSFAPQKKKMHKDKLYKPDG